MNKAHLLAFREAIGRHIGLVIPEEEEASLARTLTNRLKVTALFTPETYLLFLDSDLPDAVKEWGELACELTTGESYFFRDTGQFSLMRDKVLPDLIQARQKERSLRIWSAGCSTGEEPYSLAILLSELIPAWEGWEIVILGTDINEQAIAKAKRGLYGPWSFRRVDPEVRRRHFECLDVGDWLLSDTIRRRVRFLQSNLIKETFPNPSGEIREMDLIICRNVFIYFDLETVAMLVGKFRDTLREGGILITGHAELNQVKVPGLVPRLFRESVIYEKVALPGPPPRLPHRSVKKSATAARAEAAPKKKDPPPPSVKAAGKAVVKTDPLREAQGHFQSGRLREAVTAVERMEREEGRYFEGQCLKARILADMGRHDEVRACCLALRQIDPLSPVPWFLLAQVAHEEGKNGEARELLKKVLYLDPAFVPACLELAELYLAEGEVAKSRKLRASALERLRLLPEESVIEYYGGVTAGEVAAHLKKGL